MLLSLILACAPSIEVAPVWYMEEIPCDADGTAVWIVPEPAPSVLGVAYVIDGEVTTAVPSASLSPAVAGMPSSVYCMEATHVVMTWAIVEPDGE